ncbi:MAG TPA: type IVB secretion system coupling complex protein DotM/IcmP [Gammaproteobacteria bacterium]|jgi:intracellular multiplication protein IcmP|nr:type IVB secretion system coupling complex protein DotM/IcmP [Gammaproteobacteria bacterium]
MPPAAPQGNQSDNSYGIIWGTAAIFILLGAVWYALKDQIVYGFFTLKLYELTLLSYFSDHLNIDPHHFDKLRNVVTYAKNNPKIIKFDQLITIGAAVGEWLRYPIVLVLGVLAVVVYFGNAARSYRTTYKMMQFAKCEEVNWPQISVVTDLDLLKKDIDVGPWAMALNPMQFCKKYKLLEEYRAARQEGMHRKDWDRIEVVLKRGEASKLFSLQLGPLWKGTRYLPPYMRALFAVFAARINGDTKEAVTVLTQLNISAKSGKLDLTGVDGLIKKHEKTKLVQKVVGEHAYVMTVMAAMLRGAREDGVQASADFLWLKPVDRRLWYTLNSVGRQTPYIEVGGIHAHWLAEKEMGRKILTPMIDEATNALEAALKDILYKRDEEE